METHSQIENKLAYYDEGWDACVAGEDFNPLASYSWKTGWHDADEIRDTADFVLFETC